jgi:hypothetical protein
MAGVIAIPQVNPIQVNPLLNAFNFQQQPNPLMNAIGMQNIIGQRPSDVSSVILSSPVSYEDINYNPEIRQKIVKGYYKKLRHHWAKHFDKVLSLLTVKKDSKGTEIAELIKDAEHPDETGDKDVKVEYLNKYVLSKGYVAKVLNKFLIKHEIDWIDLAQYQHEIKRFFRKTLYKKLLKYI